jgi:hypothetical protein
VLHVSTNLKHNLQNLVLYCFGISLFHNTPFIILQTAEQFCINIYIYPSINFPLWISFTSKIKYPTCWIMEGKLWNHAENENKSGKKLYRTQNVQTILKKSSAISNNSTPLSSIDQCICTLRVFVKSLHYILATIFYHSTHDRIYYSITDTEHLFHILNLLKK